VRSVNKAVAGGENCRSVAMECSASPRGTGTEMGRSDSVSEVES
jgi:hypothetical protein